METQLIYMENMEQLSCSALIVDYKTEEGKIIIVLDQTVFYPQGGGQPFDTGIMISNDKSFIFKVTEVRFLDGVVHHIGNLEDGEVVMGSEVECQVDAQSRELNTRLHSAGHLVDMALKELSVNWTPGKGYHFPQGAYVEYAGSLDGHDVESLKHSIESKAKEIMDRDIETRVMIDKSKLQNGKPLRTVYYGDWGINCGGTHVSNLSKIGELKIRKIKKEKEMIRVSYEIVQ